MRIAVSLSAVVLFAWGCGDGDGSSKRALSGTTTQPTAAVSVSEVDGVKGCLRDAGATIYVDDSTLRRALGVADGVAADRKGSYWGDRFEIEEYRLGIQEGERTPPTALVGAPLGSGLEWDRAFTDRSALVFSVPTESYPAAFKCFGINDADIVG